MEIIGLSDEQIIEKIGRDCPGAKLALEQQEYRIEPYRRSIAPFQAMFVYMLADQYNHDHSRILEIGTAYGHSCYMIAKAAPKAQIITLNPKDWEAERARKHLSIFHNVQVVEMLSWDYLAQYTGPQLDMIFVDGDHKHIAMDMPWFNYLKIGGLFLHHDYSPENSGRPCPPVYDELNRFGEMLGRGPDELLVDDNNVGMAGWYRREGEHWQTIAQPQS